VKSLATDTPLTAVDFMPDGASLAVGSSRGKIYQYDLRMLKLPVKTISAHKTSVQCIAFQYSTALTKVRYFLYSIFDSTKNQHNLKNMLSNTM
jgi:protein NEDD1